MYQRIHVGHTSVREEKRCRPSWAIADLFVPLEAGFLRPGNLKSESRSERVRD